MNESSLIAFDESGNTGSDLLAKNQPVFVLASVRLTMSQAMELRQLITSNAQELKFSRLKKSYKNQHEILKILDHPIISHDTLAFCAFHKEYCIWVHTVDHLIEQAMYESRIDLYRNGGNLMYTNALFYLTRLYCNPSLIQEYYVAFLEMFKQRTKEAIDRFYTCVEHLIASSTNEDFKLILASILASYSIIDSILYEWEPYNFDATLTAFINLVDYWGRRSSDPFYAYVDESKPLKHFKNYIEIVKDTRIPPQLVGSDRRRLQLPLKLIDLKFEDSRKNNVVQIADILSGAVNHYHRSLISDKFDDDFAKEIGKTRALNEAHILVWPHLAFSPQDLGTEDTGDPSLVDEMARISAEFRKD